MHSVSRILMGVFPFSGAGLDTRAAIDPALTYTVPADRRAQIVYLRAGNSSDSLLCLAAMRDGRPIRLFPVGARGAVHVPLAVLEDLEPGARLELHLSAPAGTEGQVVVDIGLMEI